MQQMFKRLKTLIGFFLLLIYCVPLFGTSPRTGQMPAHVQQFFNKIKYSYSEGNLPSIMRQYKEQKIEAEKNKGHKIESVQALTLEFPVLVGKFSDSGADPWVIGDLQDELFDGPWASGTMSEYFDEISYGEFIVDGEVFGWYTAPENRAHYGNNDNGLDSGGGAEFVWDMIDAADPTVDFSVFDNDGDGDVECVIVTHDGIGGDCGSPPADANDIWAHRWSLSSAPGVAPYVTDDGVTIDVFTVQAAMSCPDALGNSIMIEIGVFCHELGHSLGLADLYDTQKTDAWGNFTTATYSAGLGHWALMAAGNWNTEAHPAHMCAWSKAELGWLSPSVVSSDLIHWPIASVSLRPTAFKLWTNGTPGSEYFMVENRTRDGFDVDLHGEGLLIYHVDENEANNGDETHKRVDLECEDQAGADHTTDADDLDEGDPFYGGNRGDGGDPFCDGDIFNSASNPSNVAYNGVNTSVEVRNITGCGSPQGLFADLIIGRPGTDVELCIRDCDSDVCDVPSAPVPCQTWWASPDIYIDNNEDGIIDPPAEGIDNKLFTRVRNVGGNDATDVDVSFYFADPSMGLLFPSSADIIDTDNIPLIDDGGSETAMVLWEIPYPPPEVNHYCIGVIAENAMDGQTSEDPIEDNNVAQINIQELYAKAGSAVPSGKPEQNVYGTTSVDEVFNTEVIVQVCCTPGRDYCGCNIRLGSPPKYNDVIVPDPWKVDLEFHKISLDNGQCVPLHVKVTNEKPVHLDSAIVPITLICGQGPVGGNILKFYIDNVPPVPPEKFSVTQIIPSGSDDMPGRNSIRASWLDNFKDEMGFPERIERWRIYRSSSSGFEPNKENLLVETCVDENPKTVEYDHFFDIPENLKEIYYKLIAVDRAGNESKTVSAKLNRIVITDVKETDKYPDDFSLSQNTPNPFNAFTEIRYTLPREDEMSLTIYSIHGKIVRELVQGRQTAGAHQVYWDGKDKMGRDVASGFYIYRLVYQGFQQHRRMLLIK
jgi:M6 family metalloprotease-like protein